MGMDVDNGGKVVSKVIKLVHSRPWNRVLGMQPYGARMRDT
jgi:hypothetical protein